MLGKIATSEFWEEKIIGGCDHISTDFGTPMCSIPPVGMCFAITPHVLRCPLGKELAQEVVDED